MAVIPSVMQPTVWIFWWLQDLSERAVDINHEGMYVRLQETQNLGFPLFDNCGERHPIIVDAASHVGFASGCQSFP